MRLNIALWKFDGTAIFYFCLKCSIKWQDRLCDDWEAFPNDIKNIHIKFFVWNYGKSNTVSNQDMLNDGLNKNKLCLQAVLFAIVVFSYSQNKNREISSKLENCIEVLYEAMGTSATFI